MSALRFDPFRELDRLAGEMMGASRAPRLMPLDAYRHGESYVLQFDLPGVDADSLEVTAERNTLTVRARRRTTAPDGAQFVLAERPTGDYGRQIVLGDGLALDAIEADYRDGVLTVTVPVAEQAKPRQIQIGRTDDRKMIDSGGDRQDELVGATT
ncbi:HSP20 family protein [Allocatelliglobosispora scoriae]|uniref:HSP20 family protein n=1 Tax=Allocatelliglobosispora scoriae TaxID=643052 RepID=A0A841BIC7_9ACTN|nr:Hsp20/alpha crystallin family protein [Allocatelliglobosispora scoriae]MBB5866651.1 HSP20 family protein [Allocatelliglobosispora scoriae]